MKKFYFSALALFLGAGFILNAQNATFMNPSFEDWTGGTPDGWTLSTTQLVSGGGALSPASPITQETSNPDPADGNSYIRLETFDLQNSSETANLRVLKMGRYQLCASRCDMDQYQQWTVLYQ